MLAPMSSGQSVKSEGLRAAGTGAIGCAFRWIVVALWMNIGSSSISDVVHGIEEAAPQKFRFMP
jgi:hypothetical protein